VPVRDSALGQIAGSEFQSDAIAGKNPNPVAAQLSARMGKCACGHKAQQHKARPLTSFGIRTFTTSCSDYNCSHEHEAPQGSSSTLVRKKGG
jgi:hypothetical protein